MMDTPLGQLLLLLGGVAGLLGLFSAVIFWSVRHLNQAMQRHMDAKLDGISKAVDEQRQRIDTHDQDIHNQQMATLNLRNEVLSDISKRYARYEDIVHIKETMDRTERAQKALFERMDRVIFRPEARQ